MQEGRMEAKEASLCTKGLQGILICNITIAIY